MTTQPITNAPGIETKSGIRRGLPLALALGLIMANGQASADPRDDVVGRAARCSYLSDYRVWLDCYYGAAQPIRGLLGLPPAPESQTRLVPGDAHAIAGTAPRATALSCKPSGLHADFRR